MVDKKMMNEMNINNEKKKVEKLDSLVKETHTVFALRSCLTSQYNGSFDNDNRPRYIAGTKRIIGSQFSEKRKIRDFLELKGGKIFIKKGNRKEFVDAFIKEYFSHYTKEQLKEESVKKEIFKALIEYYDDLTTFGVTLSVSDMNDSYTGPIQFNDTISLNDVYSNEYDASVTSCLREFKKRDSKDDVDKLKSGGGVGKFYKVSYALMAAIATILPQIREEYNLKYRDIKKFDVASILAPSRMKTTSKAGIETELYFRVESKTNFFVLRDLRFEFKFIPLKDPSQILYYEDYEIDVTGVIRLLRKNLKHIKAFYIYDTEMLDYFIKNRDGKESERMSFKDIIKTYIPEIKLVEIDPHEDIEKGYYVDDGGDFGEQ